MQLAVEISLYPLQQDYIPPIKDFIDRVNTYDKVRVTTNAMSTQIVGDYDQVMQIMHKEMKQTHEQQDKAIFVCKFLNLEPALG